MRCYDSLLSYQESSTFQGVKLNNQQPFFVLMTTILYILLTYVLFTSFFIMISVLGNIILQFLKKLIKFDWQLSKLENLFINFIVGLVIYVSCGYVLLFFRFFNFYSIYLPLIIISIFYALTHFRKNSYSRFFDNIKHYFKSNRGKIVKVQNKKSKEIFSSSK